MQYTGGYLVLREPLITSRAYKHTADDTSKISGVTLKALNTIQKTGWQINPDTSSVFFEMYVSAKPNAIRSFMPRRPDLPKIDNESWRLMTREDKNDHRKHRRKMMEDYEIQKSEYHSLLSTFTVASEVSNKPVIYFPHGMDFRTRIYPKPVGLNPQSSDLGKGLLRFSKGQPLGPGGLYWLCVGIANAAGKDKLDFDERVMWTMTNEDLFRRMVRDPIKNQAEWLEQFKDDDPWQLLGLAHEYIRAIDTDAPETYVSHMPVHMDGTCNGAQHLSLMARDKVGAEATNCRAIDERNDLYMDVADRVWDIVQREANMSPEAKEWLPRLADANARRKVVKRAVMTISYGVTEYGIAQFMMADGHVTGMAGEYPAANYMRDCIITSIDKTLSNGRQLQAYFSKCAALVAERGRPLQWDTPVGTKVTQAYKNLLYKTIKTSYGRHICYEESDDAGMNVSKMSLAASPNVVHSCDAAHLQLTTVKMNSTGVDSFSMIHDSYGVHACHVEKLHRVLREAVYDMYSGDYLNDWRESVQNYSGVSLPDVPEHGDLDIAEVLNAPYFFA